MSTSYGNVSRLDCASRMNVHAYQLIGEVDAVAQVVRTMGSIHESSRRIADIITVIDGLNAAVEAARQEPVVTAEEWKTF